MEVAKEITTPAQDERANHAKTWKPGYVRQRKQPEMTFVEWVAFSSQKMLCVEDPTQVCLGARALRNQLRLSKVLKVDSGMIFVCVCVCIYFIFFTY